MYSPRDSSSRTPNAYGQGSSFHRSSNHRKEHKQRRSGSYHGSSHGAPEVSSEEGRKLKEENEFNFKLIEVFKNFNEEFVYDENVKAWDNDRLWSIIANDVSSQLRKTFSAKDCKTAFSSLYGRYFIILKQKNYGAAYKYLFFNKLHELNLSIFDSGVDEAKVEYDKEDPTTKLKVIEADILSNCESKKPKEEEAKEEPIPRTFRYEEYNDNVAFDEYNSNDGSQRSTPSAEYASSTQPQYLPPKRFESKTFMIDNCHFGKTFKNKFYVNEIENKELLVIAVMKFNNQFLSYNLEEVYETDEPWSMVMTDLRSKIRDYSETHCKTHFQELLHQYKYILERLPHWSRQKALKFWPFFRSFHCRLNLRSFFWNIDELKKSFDNHLKDDGEDDYEQFVYKSGVIPEGYFYTHNADQKRKLLSTMNKFEEEFISFCMSEDVWLTDQVWKFVVKDLSKTIEKFNITKCKMEFVRLLDRYITILRDLPTLSPSDCRKVFPVFDILHDKMNLSSFFPNIRELRRRYNDFQAVSSKQPSGSSKVVPKTIAAHIIAAAAPAITKRVHSPPPAKVEPRKPTIREGDDEEEEDVELVLAVREHMNEFKDYNISDDDIWTRIALDLARFEKDVFEKGRKKWRNRFEDMMRKFYRMSAEFNAEQAMIKWALYNQFSQLNLNPMLDRLANPIKKTTLPSDPKRLKSS